MELIRINMQGLAEAMLFVSTEPRTEHGADIITILLDGDMLHDAIAERILETERSRREGRSKPPEMPRGSGDRTKRLGTRVA